MSSRLKEVGSTLSYQHNIFCTAAFFFFHILSGQSCSLSSALSLTEKRGEKLRYLIFPKLTPLTQIQKQLTSRLNDRFAPKHSVLYLQHRELVVTPSNRSCYHMSYLPPYHPKIILSQKEKDLIRFVGRKNQSVLTLQQHGYAHKLVLLVDTLAPEGESCCSSNSQ